MAAVDHGEALRYAAVGMAQNAGNLATFAGLTAVGTPYRSAAVVAGMIALALSFVLNRRFTFRGERDPRTAQQVIRYATVFAGATLIGLVLLTALVELLHTPAVLGQAVAIALVAPASYLAQRGWTFAKPHSR